MNYTIERAIADDLVHILEVMKPWNMHRVPSVEMGELDLSCFFVAKVDGRIVGAAGYQLLSDTLAKTTLLGVIPELLGTGIGKDLQHRRMQAVYDLGAKRLLTNADRPGIILWYKKHFSYKEVGQLQKQCSFGDTQIDHWTTLECDLEDYFSDYEIKNRYRDQYMQQNDAYPLVDYPPLITNVCLTGMVPKKSLTQFVPISVDEIIEDAKAVYDAGARIVHLHARDADGNPTSDADYYEKIITSLREVCPGLVCCVTTSGRGGSDFERRSEVLHLTGAAKPDMASLTLGSLNFISNSSTNSIETIERLAMLMKEKAIKPELEVFDSGMINLAKYLERNKLIEGKKYFNLLLGNINTAPATIGDLSRLYESLPNNSIWAAAGLGQFQLPMNTAAIIAGGHVRIGLEDSIYYDYQKTQLASNLELIQRITRLADELQRPIASAEYTRDQLGLPVISISNGR